MTVPSSNTLKPMCSVTIVYSMPMLSKNGSAQTRAILLPRPVQADVALSSP